MALLLLLSLSACKGSSKDKPSPAASPSDAASTDAPAVPTVDLSFVRGTIVIAAEHDHHHVEARALDPATGAWTPLGASSELSLFPTGHVVQIGRASCRERV